jgi:hypothetical protein
VGGAAQTRDINPNFSGVATMADVAASIQTALRLPANFGATITVAYNVLTRVFTLTSTGGVLTNFTDAAGHSLSLTGSDDTFLSGFSLLEPLLPRSQRTLNPGGQGDLHFSMAVDPTDPNFIYVGGDRQTSLSSPNFLNNLSHSEVGVTDWVGQLYRIHAVAGAVPGLQVQLTGSGAQISAGNAALGNRSPVLTGPHADSRFMTFTADGTLYEADDGGIFRLSNPTGGGGDRFWQSLGGNLSATEFNDVAYDPIHEILMGGTQDVGNQVQSATHSTSWEAVTLGDGKRVKRRIKWDAMTRKI